MEGLGRSIPLANMESTSFLCFSLFIYQQLLIARLGACGGQQAYAVVLQVFCLLRATQTLCFPSNHSTCVSAVYLPKHAQAHAMYVPHANTAVCSARWQV
jgi:hypothetical protein